MYVYDTVVEAITPLRQRGYMLDFNLYVDQVRCQAENTSLNPAEFEIIEHYRFEGNTNPSDEDIVYATLNMDGKIGITITKRSSLEMKAAYSMMAKDLIFLRVLTSEVP